MASGIDVPLELAAFLCASGAAVGAWLTHLRAARRLDPRRNAVRDLLKHHNLAHAVDLAKHRDARRHASHAVVHGRIDQLSDHHGAMNHDTAESVRAHVAAVMRVGLRRQDRVALTEGDGFTILIPGADERAAVRIAERLRHALAEMRLPQLGQEVRLTASFGVAADRVGEDGEVLERRARRALDAAVAQGQDHVVPASEIEEIHLLPAPSPASAADPAASAA